VSFLYPTKIISGGQTGVDRAALDWAIASDLTHGGWCPFGRLAQDGKVPDHYLLKETQSSGYSQRTRKNIEETDATLIIHQGLLAGGSKLTLRFAQELKKPYCLFDLDKPWSPQADQARQWFSAHSVQILNIAGPSETRHPGIYDLTRKVLPLIFQ
jgi:hypothetical protein